MVRFNDKPSITTVAGNDIIPITDISESSDDKKITINQLSQFTVDNVNTLTDGKGFSKNDLTDDLKQSIETTPSTIAITNYDATVTYSKDAWVVGAVDENSEKSIYKSLLDNNTGNDLSDTTYWKEVKLGGGSISDIDGLQDALNAKADVDLSNVPTSKAILTESYVNDNSWYRVYSDGWCEQGGLVVAASFNYTTTVTLLKEMASVLNVTATQLASTAVTQTSAWKVTILSSTQIQIRSSLQSPNCRWKVAGYIA